MNAIEKSLKLNTKQNYLIVIIDKLPTLGSIKLTLFCQ
ncbi:hypothetical protein M997_1585 [Proteus hauseri ATCC 700826]|uniref:Uncharacterized protein n=1 Tax=Proteus hauseri ATCC 700826 TaxID=1354271 RepID=A0AAJ3LTX1_PROHU|nr:hypothetical protein M997_1585 [Proteus hauseri ATCC 700826]